MSAHATKATKLLADLRSANKDKPWTGPGGLMHLAAEEIERLTVVFDEACHEITLCHDKPCFCKYCRVEDATP